MNGAQALWSRQAQSDHALYVQLGGPEVEAHESHLLHYLQMATEKLSKAYFGRSGVAPPKTHSGFVRFLMALLDRNPTELERTANVLGFRRRDDFERWVLRVRPLAYSLQNIAPAEAGDGPNPEYPWPHGAPRHCPIGHSFDLCDRLNHSGEGRKLLHVIGRAIAGFSAYA